MFLYVLFSSSIVALFSVDVFKSMLDLPKHGFTLYALDISEVSVDVLKVRQSSEIEPLRLKSAQARS